MVNNIRMDELRRAINGGELPLGVFNNPNHDLLSTERHDTLHKVDEAWRILQRVIYLDQSTLGTLNLSIFL